MFTSNHAKKVVTYLENMRKNPRIDALIKGVEACGDVVLIGGAVRDIALRSEEPRDFDLIVCGRDADLQECMQSNCATRNSFGGYKIEIDDCVFDIWSIENHWPVKRGIITKEKEKVTDGAFYNIDAICMYLSDNSFSCEGFNDAIRTMQLEIPLEDAMLVDQPHIFNIMRAYRLRQRWALTFSGKVERYINEWIVKTPQAMQLLTAEALRHFGDASFLPCEPDK